MNNAQNFSAQKSLPTSPLSESFKKRTSPLTLHAFCDDQSTANAIKRSGSDPLLGNATMNIQIGGIAAAWKYYAETRTPNLLIIESRLDGEALLAGLDRLAEVCDPDTRVIVIGHVNDVLLYRELMRRHISDYLFAPILPVQIVESICNIFSLRESSAQGRVVAFFGAKGGCGSSTICHNIAWTSAEMLHGECMIADFNLAFGTVGLNFNQDVGRGISDALTAGDRCDAAMLEKLKARCSDRLTLLAPAYALDQDTGISPQRASKLVDRLCQNASLVMLDLPHQWADWSRQLISQADNIIITAEPDLANLRNTKNLIEAIRSMGRTGSSPVLLLNKVNMPRRPEITPTDFASAVDLKPSAIIEFDAHLFGTAANNGLMISEMSRKTKTAGIFRKLAEHLTGTSPSPQNITRRLAPLRRLRFNFGT